MESKELAEGEASYEIVFRKMIFGTGGQPLSERLPDGFDVALPVGTWKLTGGMRLHQLAVEDKLRSRASGIEEEIINATCSVDNGRIQEVSKQHLF